MDHPATVLSQYWVPGNPTVQAAGRADSDKCQSSASPATHMAHLDIRALFLVCHGMVLDQLQAGLSTHGNAHQPTEDALFNHWGAGTRLGYISLPVIWLECCHQPPAVILAGGSSFELFRPGIDC